MAGTAVFASTVNVGMGLISTANTNRDGTTGTRVTILTSGTLGTRVDNIRINAVGTTTAGMVRLWLNDTTTAFLLDEVPVTAITPSGTVEAWTTTLTYTGASVLLMKPGWLLQASTHNAESFHVIASGGDF